MSPSLPAPGSCRGQSSEGPFPDQLSFEFRQSREERDEAPKVLFRLARERLRTERLVFPAPDRIVRLVSSARGRAQERTYTLVEPLLSAERRAPLDGLLEAKAANRGSTLKWLGQGASGESPGSIKSEVAKLAFLRQLEAPEWDLSDLNPNRRKFLAPVGRRSTSQTLQRMPDRRAVGASLPAQVAPRSAPAFRRTASG